MGYCTVPQIVPDSLKAINLSQEALEAVVSYVNDMSKKIDSESSMKDIELALYHLKLILRLRTQGN